MQASIQASSQDKRQAGRRVYWLFHVSFKEEQGNQMEVHCESKIGASFQIRCGDKFLNLDVTEIS